jgi:hypothetical protein
MAIHHIDPKATDEIVTVQVDFSAIAQELTNCVVTISHAGGKADPNPSMMLLGTSSITGTTVAQQIQGGVAGAQYAIRFLANFQNGDRFGETVKLSVN